MSQLRKVGWMALGAVAVIAVLAASANAQGGGGGRRGGGGMGGGGFGQLGLLSSEQVQKELELVDDQKVAIEKIREEMRASFQGGGGGGGGNREERMKRMTEMREQTDKKLASILLPDQYTRLKEIELQVQGASALAEQDVADKVGLSDDQKAKIASVREDFMAKRGELFQGGGGGGGNNPERRAKMEEIRKGESDQMLAVLTPEQKSKFESMKGKIIDIDRSQLGFTMGGGGRRGGGPQGGSTP